MIRRSISAIAVLALLALGVAAIDVAVAKDNPSGDGWFTLFDGKSLDGWSPSENKGTWHVADGALVSGGPRSHLFYSGPILDHNFKNFELKAEVMAQPHSNGGIYFHTDYQETDWPAKGYEAQVNNTHTDWRKTGSLYAVKDVQESPVKDGEWFEYDILVEDKHITLKVNDQTTVDYDEPEGGPKLSDRPGRMLGNGTIALQAHDPGSTVYFRNIRIKPLP